MGLAGGEKVGGEKVGKDKKRIGNKLQGNESESHDLNVKVAQNTDMSNADAFLCLAVPCL